MDLRETNKLGFAAFGQLLNEKADFRIVGKGGILEGFNDDLLDKLLQLPYGFEINSKREFLSVIKLEARAGKFGSSDYYLLIAQYKYAGIDINKRKNYYGACLAFKYDGFVICPENILLNLKPLLEFSESQMRNYRYSKISIPDIPRTKYSLHFENPSLTSQMTFCSREINDKLSLKFLEYCFANSKELSGIGRVILFSGVEKLTGVNSNEIKIIDTDFEKIMETGISFLSNFITKQTNETVREKNIIMLENKDDAKIETIIENVSRPLIERIDALEKQMENKESKKLGKHIGLANNIDKVFIVLLIVLLFASYFVIQSVAQISIVTKSSSVNIVNQKMLDEYKTELTNRIDSVYRKKEDSVVVHIAAPNQTITKIARLYNVYASDVFNKNSAVKPGDTLFINIK